MACTPLQVIIQSEEPFVLNLQHNEKILALKEIINARIGMPISDQVLIHYGKELFDHEDLQDHDIRNLAVISIFNKLLGGKVHGSLSRAGKVPKKEKPRPKTGRCKQRAKYIRRFINCPVLPPGKRRRGPNSNASK